MRSSAWIALLGILVPASALAGWPSDPLQNVPVCTANAYQSPPFTLSDAAGGAVLIWADHRDSPPGKTTTGIYAQRVNSNGSSLWTLNGSPILVNTSDNVNFDAACPDGAGGAYVAWLNATQGGTVRIQRIASDGLPAWGANGIDVGVSAVVGSGFGITSALVPDGSSGVIVVWRSREGPGSSFGIRAQHLDVNGTSGWGPSGVLLRSASSNLPQAPRAVVDGQGGVVATWVQNGWEVRCQGVQSNGVITMNPAGALIVSGANFFGIALVPDGAHGAIVTWATRESASLSCVRAQRVDPDGDLLWPVTGVLLGTNTFTTPGELRACTSGSSGAIVAWKQVDLQGPTRAQAQKLDSDGALAWPEGGVTVCVPTTDMLYVAMSSDGADGAFLVYTDVMYSPDPGTYRYDVAAARVTATGEAPWEPTGVFLSTATRTQDAPAVATDGAGGAIIGWRDGRWGQSDSQTDVYIQNLHADGTMGGGVASVDGGHGATWARVWPQPSRSQVELAFMSPGGFTSVTILDPQGRRIRELLRESVPAGETRLRWDGLDGAGAPARAGLYFASIATSSHSFVRKIVLER